uniref:AB hydrolase-1 domain-containing protein n=1 Tax=Tetradesmus obliquus TaxID=3088 RepID=A0A383V6P7_TETOB|eukprot:jgi/Sobl393_1/6996/SZX60264.1
MAADAAAATQYVTTNDGVRLAYEQAGTAGPVVVLIHGWSGSRKYFCHNMPALAEHCQVYAYDQRFHGDSDSPSHGFHVARLAADLRDFLQALQLADVTVVGSSMGCAVIWSYVELFGLQRLKQAVFVDQAPLQNRAPDWQLGSKGCYDAATLAGLQKTLAENLEAVADGNAAGCLSLPLPEATMQLLKQETMRCKPQALGQLMADHAQLDWRPLLPLLALPCLNCVGGCSGVFPPEGCLHIAELAPDCCSVVFSRANHWLYLEQPQEFNALLLDFVAKGNAARPKRAEVA